MKAWHKWLLSRLAISVGLVAVHFIPPAWHLPFHTSINLLWVWLL